MKGLIYILTFIAVSLIGYGQETIEALVNKTTVGVNERFTFQIVTNSNCQITSPTFDGLRVMSGPNSSSSRSISIINGRQTITVEYTYTYTLMANKEGKFTISSVTMDCDGKKKTTDAITINATKNQPNEAVNSDFYMRLLTNKSSVYEGEPFIVTLKYFAKLPPENIESFDLGDVDGVWRQDLNPSKTNFSTDIESVNGVRYYTIILREELCFAQRSGKINIEPYSTSMIFSQGFFNRFRKETKSNSLEINVKPINSAGANNYKGLVGDFKMSSEISKISAKMGEAIDLKIILEGKGNMQSVGNLDLKFPKDFEVFDPEIDEKTTVTRSGISGKMTYNFVLIPTHYGDFTIPAYTFSYFDLGSKKMKTISSESFQIHVEKPDGVAGEIVVPKNEIDVAENTIRYIHTDQDDIFTYDQITFGKLSYFALLSSPLILSFFFIFFKRKKENLTDEEKLKLAQKKVSKEVLLDIEKAKSLVDSDEKLSLKTIQNALLHFFKIKFNVGLSSLSQNEITNRLKQQEVEGTDIDQFNTIWRAIELGQYAPITTSNLKQTIEDAETLIQNLNKTL